MSVRHFIAWAVLRLLFPRATSRCAGVALLRLDATATCPLETDGRLRSLQCTQHIATVSPRSEWLSAAPRSATTDRIAKVIADVASAHGFQISADRATVVYRNVPSEQSLSVTILAQEAPRR